MHKIYKIRKAFLIPFSITIMLLFILLLISLFAGQKWEQIILSFLFLSSLACGIEMSRRQMIVSEEGLQIKKFFRTNNFSWPEITQLAVVVMRNKAYFLLTTTNGFHIFSNLFENHALLIRSIMDNLEEERIELEIKNYLEHPVERRSLVVMSWVTVIIVIAIIFSKLLMF